MASPHSTVHMSQSDQCDGHSHSNSAGHGHSHDHHGHSHEHANDTAGDIRKRSVTSNGVTQTMGIIFPFHSNSRTLLGLLAQEVKQMVSQRQAKLIFTFMVLNLMTVFLLVVCNMTTNSMALTAYLSLVIFDLFALLTCLMSVWVEQQSPTPSFSFGYQRFEVLAVFTSTMLSGLGSFFIVKECTERIVQQPDVHTGRLLPGALFVFIYHQLVTYTLTSSNRAFNHVISASSSSWLQEHVADMCEGFCHVVPGLSKILLPRINPFVLLGFAGGMAIFVTDVLIDVYSYHSADTVTAMLIAIMTFGTMFPMAVYSGKILLQTTPAHIIGQLDKCIREASTLDGVLEFRNEHFWTLSFGKLAGSLHVRVRRDADEQMVLAHVTNRLSNLVHNLTIQVFKDDWTTRTSVYQMLASSGYGTKYANQPTGALPIREGSPIAMYRPLTPVTATINNSLSASPRSGDFSNPLVSDLKVPLLPVSNKTYTPRMSSPISVNNYSSPVPTTYNSTALAYMNSISKSKYTPVKDSKLK